MGNIIEGVDTSRLQIATIKADIQRYWGRPREDIFFLISYEHLKRVRDSSPTNHVALKIKNKNSPNRVDADWVKFNNNNRPNNNFDYYVLTSQDVDNLTRPLGDGNEAISARIAKDVNNKCYIFFHRCRIVNQDGGPGGEGDIAGAKIPANP